MEEISATHLKCSSCQTNTLSAETFCNNCGYPLQGSEEEQRKFLNQREIQQIDLETHQKQIKDAGKTLYWIAGLTFLGEIISLGINKDESASVGFTIAAGAFAALIFIGLGFWSRSKPTAAIISGFCVYVLLHLLAAIADPVTLVQGVIVKIIIIGYLIKGIKSSIEADKIIKEHNLPVYTNMYA